MRVTCECVGNIFVCAWVLAHMCAYTYVCIPRALCILCALPAVSEYVSLSNPAQPFIVRASCPRHPAGGLHRHGRSPPCSGPGQDIDRGSPLPVPDPHHRRNKGVPDAGGRRALAAASHPGGGRLRSTVPHATLQPAAALMYSILPLSVCNYTSGICTAMDARPKK